MRLRVTIVVSLAVIACIVAAGCTSSVTNTSSSTTEAKKSSPTGHDKVLAAVIDDDKQAYVKAAWTKTVNTDAQWINDTTALVIFKVGYSKGVLNYTAKYVKFPTIDDANAFVKSISAGYTTANALTLSSDPALTTATSVNAHENYRNVTGTSPSTLSYVKLVRDEPKEYENRYIVQTSDVVVIYDATVQRV